MRRTIALLSCFLILIFNIPALAQTATDTTEADIRAVMAKSVVDWNKGDLVAFASSYKNSPDILYIGSKVNRGYYGMLEAYKKNYATAEVRGKLTYLNLEVHPLDDRFATAVGGLENHHGPLRPSTRLSSQTEPSSTQTGSRPLTFYR
jgi:hypothetical protein